MYYYNIKVYEKYGKHTKKKNNTFDVNNLNKIQNNNNTINIL